ncbi:glycosyltransferase family 4 protein [Polycladidibacter hongkongensis]|uniref:glycosyltransferase family 4 protein n=1 Tax=Polycladidibacter hongkongensis TaxID=1647556 RepID=UPI00083486E4|nr:glycosyltransferase family 4 protein [Pseudovibrio hongkongensis]
MLKGRLDMPASFNSQSDLVVVLDKGMSFSPATATSIDLCTYDLVRKSKYNAQTTILANSVEGPFSDVNLMFYDRKKPAQLAVTLQSLQPKLIIVQQRVKAAAKIARMFPQTPVIVHRHNFVREKRSWLKRWSVSRRYRRLAGLIFVSNRCEKHFIENWPNLNIQSIVVPNSLELDLWRPQRARDKSFFYAGRMARGKGVLPLAKAMVKILPQLPDWKFEMCAVTRGEDSSHYTEVLKTLEPVRAQCFISENLQHSEVVRCYERAAVAVVPSIETESFGRTALEAMAGGAALITTGVGGLGEVAGEAALYVTSNDEEALKIACLNLAEDTLRREALAGAGMKRCKEHYDLQRSVDLFDKFVFRYLGEAKQTPQSQIGKYLMDAR